jgi:hypothetical protein
MRRLNLHPGEERKRRLKKELNAYVCLQSRGNLRLTGKREKISVPFCFCS